MPGPERWRTLIAGGAYFALVFVAGFALGLARVLVLAPVLGETAAVVIELPVILTAAWLACGWLVRRLHVPRRWPSRVWMGGVAFTLLMAAEALLGTLGQGAGLAAHIEGYAQTPRLIGLGGQVLFALFPLIRR
ncbi:MAG: hypothetical protein RLO50_18425 [Azospirillaceae bacterium]